jgi:hypothetical protein
MDPIPFEVDFWTRESLQNGPSPAALSVAGFSSMHLSIPLLSAQPGPATKSIVASGRIV